MLSALFISLVLTQSSVPATNAGASHAVDTADRTMGLHVLTPGFVENRCVGKFRRLKIEMISLDFLLDLDAGGAVTNVRLISDSPDPKLEQCLLESIRKVRFRDEAPRHGIYVSSMANASLLPKPPKHVQYTAADAAVIYRWKSAVGGLCKVAGKPAPGPSKKSACTAFVSMIDAGVTSWFADNNKVSPGTHKLSLTCATEQFNDVGLPMPTWVTQVHAFMLEPGTNYRVEPHWDGENCIVDLIDVRKGLVLEKLPL